MQEALDKVITYMGLDESDEQSDIIVDEWKL